MTKSDGNYPDPK